MTEDLAIKAEHVYLNLDPSTGRPAVLARSSGISPTHIAECNYVFPVRQDAPDTGSLMLAAGDTERYVLIHHGLNESGSAQTHYLFFPKTAVDNLAGAYAALAKLFPQRQPDFSANQTIPAFEATVPAGRSGEAVRELVAFCGENYDVLRALLSATVQGDLVTICGSTEPLEKRLAVITGILQLLPAPVRSEFAFATHGAAAKKDTIRFLDTQPDPADGGLIYDRTQGALSGQTSPNAYSDYIIYTFLFGIKEPFTGGIITWYPHAQPFLFWM